ncbi:Phosphatidyl-myo-inositol mannosyltransferase [Methylobacterium haplocladii]|nr:glycosyltransferase family 4 protein [Methylobacterium haplocladii]GJD82353.1 Phosphatidyl-myo-inositol mannosyltransferase [Methylobacterium haplocladii]
MKIALIAHLKFPIGQPYAGGLEMHTHLLARALKQKGHAVTLFAAAGSDPLLDPVAVCPPTGDSLGDPLIEAEIATTEHDAYQRIMDTVEEDGFDLVHNNSLHDLPLRRSRRMGIPWVTVLHTPPFPSLAAGVRAAVGNISYVAVSPTLAQTWQHLVPDVQVIGNGIDLSTFTFNPRADTPPFAIWSGRIVPEKGLHLAIDATRRAGLPLLFAGPLLDPDYWAAEIEPRLGPDLTYLGHLMHSDLAAYLGRARVAVVSPCWEEPFGLVVAEALACGTPVAAFRRGALADILDDACGRLGRADDVVELADAIRAAAELDRQACRRRAALLYDVEAMTARYEEVYRHLLEQRKPPHRRPLSQPSSATAHREPAHTAHPSGHAVHEKA